MRDFDYDLSQVHHTRFRVEEAAANLKAMRQAPPNTHLWSDIRAAEHFYNACRSQLSMAECILRKYHPDQPRVPAGNPDGGQWTDAGGGSGTGTSGRPRATLINYTAASSTQSHTQGTSWIGSATEALRPLTRRVPGLAAIGEVLGAMRWTDSIDNHVQEYNDLVADVGNDTSIVPVISSRARSYTKEETGVKTAVAALSRDEVAKYCPNFLTVQGLLDKAATRAGPLSNFGSPKLRGTAIHTFLKAEIDGMRNPNLNGSIVPEIGLCGTR